MRFLSKQLHFVSSFKSKVIVGFILGAFLSFIIIGLEPFDTNEYQSKYRILALLGFGGVLCIVFIIQSLLENVWYIRRAKIWRVSYEITSTILFFTLSGTAIYLYNHMIVNDLSYSLRTHWWYFTHIVSVMIPVVCPLFIYLRQKFGERILPVSPSTITISGENKNELLTLDKTELRYVKAFENYIEIVYVDSDKNLLSKTFRQTLSNVHQQIPFIERCHRSYLVNTSTIKKIHGNSQRAKIIFQDVEEEIPLSKTLYKGLKSRVG